MISCAKVVESDFVNLLHTIHENATHLCPKVMRPRPHVKRLSPSEKRPDSSPAPTIDEERELGPVVGEIRRLAENLLILLNNLTALSQFEDREIKIVFGAFAGDLQVGKTVVIECHFTY